MIRRQFLTGSIMVATFVAAISLNIAKASETHTVEISQFAFIPAKITVAAGDTIIWVNRDIVPHTATADNGSWDTGEILTNQQKRIIVAEDQSLSYYCAYHPSMKAEISLMPQ